ncbi:MAG: hypothetical protein ACRDPA_20495 [Solirubrobacteraceae bacterium]
MRTRGAAYGHVAVDIEESGAGRDSGAPVDASVLPAESHENPFSNPGAALLRAVWG